jgi:hypothetical protein
MMSVAADGTRSVPATLIEDSVKTIAEFYRFAEPAANELEFRLLGGRAPAKAGTPTVRLSFLESDRYSELHAS